jgi:hypothetical protein
MGSLHLLLNLPPMSAVPNRLAGPTLAETLLDQHYSPPPMGVPNNAMPLPIRVRNVVGTADLDCPCGSWLDHHERAIGRPSYLCANIVCAGSPVVGGHVIKIGNSMDSRWYIVPLCSSCNHKEEEFEVSGNVRLVPASLSLKCGR